MLCSSSWDLVVREGHFPVLKPDRETHGNPRNKKMEDDGKRREPVEMKSKEVKDQWKAVEQLEGEEET